MNTTALSNRCRLPALMLACAGLAAAAPIAFAADDANARYLVYVPSRASSVDHAANARAFEERGYTVRTISQGAERDRDYVLRIRNEIRGLIASGVPAQAITVMGSGRGSSVTALVSMATGNRHVGYVMLGSCDARLADIENFRMSGRVLGLRDAADRGSHSCRPLWQDSPRVSQRRDMVLRTGLGASLFDAPHDAWVGSVTVWSESGHVDLGRMRVAAND